MTTEHHVWGVKGTATAVLPEVGSDYGAIEVVRHATCDQAQEDNKEANNSGHMRFQLSVTSQWALPQRPSSSTANGGLQIRHSSSLLEQRLQCGILRAHKL